MSTFEKAGVAETPAVVITSPENKAVSPRAFLANIDPHTYEFKYFAKPKRPKGIVSRGDQYEVEYILDSKGNPVIRNGRKVAVTFIDSNGKRQKRYVLDANGNKIVKRKRSGNQVCAIEIQRCAKAVTTREAAIATAEKKLMTAKDAVAIEKAKERLLLAIIKRDYTVERLDTMLAFAKQHNITTLKPHSDTSEDEKKKEKPSKGKLILASAHEKIIHLDKVKDDLLLTAKVQAQGTAKDAAFIALHTKYKWLVSSWSKPGKTPLETDDAVSKGVQGIWDAAMRFDVNRSGENGKFAVFSTVAYRWVHRNTRARTKADVKPGQFKVGSETKYLVSIDGQVNSDNEATEFTLASTESTEISDAMKMDVAAAMAALDEAQRMILEYRHFHQLPTDEIARIMRMPEQKVRILSSEANRILQDRLSAYGN